jgi:hypothetical protein
VLSSLSRWSLMSHLSSRGVLAASNRRPRLGTGGVRTVRGWTQA